MPIETWSQNTEPNKTSNYHLHYSLSDLFEAWGSTARVGNRDEPITVALGFIGKASHYFWVAFDESIPYVIVHKVLSLHWNKRWFWDAQGKLWRKIPHQLHVLTIDPSNPLDLWRFALGFGLDLRRDVVCTDFLWQAHRGRQRLVSWLDCVGWCLYQESRTQSWKCFWIVWWF